MANEEIQVSMGLSTAVFQGELARAKTYVTAFADGTKSALGGIQSMISGAVIGFASIEGIRMAVGKTLEWAEAARQANENSGITVELFQQLQDSALRAGVGVDKLGNALVFLSSKVGEARKGNKEANATFVKWGIDIKDLTLDEIYTKITDRINELSDATEKAAARTELFGKAGKQLQGVIEAKNARAGGMFTETDVDFLTKLGHLPGRIWEGIALVTGKGIVGGAKMLGLTSDVPTGITEAQIQAKIAENNQKAIDENQEAGQNLAQAVHTQVLRERAYGKGAYRAQAIAQLEKERDEAEQKATDQANAEAEDKKEHNIRLKRGNEEFEKDEKDYFTEIKHAYDEAVRVQKAKNEKARETLEMQKQYDSLEREKQHEQFEESQRGSQYGTLEEIANFRGGPFQGVAQAILRDNMDQKWARIKGNFGRAEWDRQDANSRMDYLASMGVIDPREYEQHIANQAALNTSESIATLVHLAEEHGIKIIPVMAP